MQTSVTFKNLDPSDHLKSYVGDKLDRFDKFLDNPAEANVVLAVEKFRHIAEINISGEQDTAPPRAFNHIHIEYVARGRGIKEKALTDAISLSLNQYCSVSGTLKGKAKLTTTYQIVELE